MRGGFRGILRRRRVAFEAYPCANNFLTTPTSRTSRGGSSEASGEALRASPPPTEACFNLGDRDAVAAAREKDDDDAPVVTAVGGEIFERVVSPGEEDNEQRGAEYRSPSSKRRPHPGGAARGPAADAPAPASSSGFVVYEKKIERRDSGLVVVFSVVSASGAVWAYNCGA